jgi:hypothetical protein
VGAGLAAVSGVVGKAVAAGAVGGEATGAAGGVVAAGAADEGALGVVVWLAAGGAVVGAGCVLSWASAAARPASVNAKAKPASLETFEYSERL